MADDGNFSNIDGFNAAPRREHPGLRAAVASALLGALAIAVWVACPYVGGVILVLAP